MYLSTQLMRTVTASHLTLRALSTPPLFQHRQIAAVEWCGTTRPGLAWQKRTQHASSVISKSGVLSAKPSSVFLALLAGKLAEKYIYARMLLFHVSVVNECPVVFHSGPVVWK
ncbi:hypothetical protein H766_YJM681L05245 [Saccharomyces cerevisiae YJM681]|nr:hypothetical protein H766_YJM681L05245 [Saccharomyces cerevisiae YJM681]